MILVTGGTGFVGTALLDALKAEHIEFRAVSREARDGFMAVGAFGAMTDWSAALSGVKTVVHLVARTHVMHETAADPMAAYRDINVTASLRLAEEAARLGVRRFIFMSSIKVNGEETLPGAPFTPSSSPRPEDTYGRSKLEAEEALKAIGERTGMEITIIRPPLIHGPGVKANFASLVRLATSGLPLPFGLVRNRRSLVFVGNLADFVLAAIRHPAAGNRTFLVADDPPLSIAGLIRGIAAAGGTRARLLPVPVSLMKAGLALTGKAEIARRLFGSLEVDSRDARDTLGWHPPFTLEEGLRRTLGQD